MTSAIHDAALSDRAPSSNKYFIGRRTDDPTMDVVFLAQLEVVSLSNVRGVA